MADGREVLLRSTHNTHKVAFSEQAREVIRISDIILETLDARYVDKSRIRELEEQVAKQGKLLIHVINKVDLLPKGELPDVSHLPNPVFISAKTRQGIRNLREKIHILAKKFKEHPIVHVGVIGYPNTGKSLLINLLSRKSAARFSPHSGFTKGIQKIKFAKGILLLDTPGVIPSTENLFGLDVRKHALLGVHTPENVKGPDFVVFEIMRLNPGKLEKHYHIEAKSESKGGDSELLIEELGKRWNLLKKKGEVNIDRVARRILKDWHEGKIR